MSPSPLFIVRVWEQRGRRGRRSFRACVRAVDAERGLLFTRPAEVARFFREQCRCVTSSGEAGCTADESDSMACD